MKGQEVRDSICSRMTEVSAKLSNDPAQSETLLYVNVMMNLCILGYLEKDLYQCLKQKNVTHADIMQAFNLYMIGKDNLNYQFGTKITECVTKHTQSLTAAIERTVRIASGSQFELYKPISNPSNDRGYTIHSLDTDESVAQKMAAVQHGPCAPYFAVYQTQETVDNMVNYGVTLSKMGFCAASHLCADEFIAARKRYTTPEQCMSDERLLKCINRYQAVRTKYTDIQSRNQN
jgi:hypothetical protein